MLVNDNDNLLSYKANGPPLEAKLGFDTDPDTAVCFSRAQWAFRFSLLAESIAHV